MLYWDSAVKTNKKESTQLKILVFHFVKIVYAWSCNVIIKIWHFLDKDMQSLISWPNLKLRYSLSKLMYSMQRIFHNCMFWSQRARGICAMPTICINFCLYRTATKNITFFKVKLERFTKFSFIGALHNVGTWIMGEKFFAIPTSYKNGQGPNLYKGNLCRNCILTGLMLSTQSFYHTVLLYYLKP